MSVDTVESSLDLLKNRAKSLRNCSRFARLRTKRSKAKVIIFSANESPGIIDLVSDHNRRLLACDSCCLLT